MEINILLADSAQIDPSGKAHALGIGWARTVSPTPPMGILLFISIMPDESQFLNQTLEIDVSLVDQDENPVAPIDPNAGSDAFKVHLEVETNYPQNQQDGLPIGYPLALNIGPGLPIPAGHLYAWKAVLSVKNDATVNITRKAIFLVAEGAIQFSTPQQQPA